MNEAVTTMTAGCRMVFARDGICIGFVLQIDGISLSLCLFLSVSPVTRGSQSDSPAVPNTCRRLCTSKPWPPDDVRRSPNPILQGSVISLRLDTADGESSQRV